MKLNKLAHAMALMGMATVALAQSAADAQLQRVEVTGSSIKRVAAEGALPVQVISSEDLKRQGIVTAEQLMSVLSVAGNGLDNLASNSDVAAGSGRGSNGLSAANLRGQGSNNTLVLLNGRRLAAHGLNGGSVDLNQIPMAAVERVEILKDGASAVYGTDAIGGVINFILKKNYQGLTVSAFTDVTQQGGANVNRVSVTGGAGDLDTDKFNFIVGLTRSENQALLGSQRGFINTNQPNRGVSPDTGGTPVATVVGIASLWSGLSNKTSTGPTLPGSTQTYARVNPLALPGGAGCSSVPGMAPYEYMLWQGTLSNKYSCTFDTGVAATLQQPVANTNLVARGTFRIGEHELYGEITQATVKSSKVFSAQQLSSSATVLSGTAPYQINNPLYNLAYPSTGSSYNTVFNQMVAVFPTLEANRGQPLAFRWRCVPCGPRQYDTTTETSRGLVGLEGPLPGVADWDYRAGISTASSESSSILGGGYYFGAPLATAINTGVLNPFLAPNQPQTAAATAALAAASATGVKLYGGKFTLVQADAKTSGPVFKMAGGDAMAAVGVDLRTEKFAFNGKDTDLITQIGIPNAAFDYVNTMDTMTRDIKAVYGELLLPITKELEATVALRRDDYTGFGSTTNPKVSLRFAPVEHFMVRGSYNTGFRVPDFKQQFFGVTESPGGTNTVDPVTCPTLKVSTTPGCQAIVFTTLFGGNPALQPEKSKQGTVGFVWEPTEGMTVGADWWTINKTGTIQAAALTGANGLLANYASFASNFIRDASGNIVQVDTRWINAGETVTTGVDINASLYGKLDTARWGIMLEGTYLLEKKSRPVPNAAFGDSLIGQFNANDDPALRWKHSLTASYTDGPWSASITQLYRSGYKQAVIYVPTYTPTDWNPDVDAYILYNTSVTYSGIKNLDLTFGIKNLLNTDPPFAISYDTNTGAGSSWDPRVADPRGRAYTMQATYKF